MNQTAKRILSFVLCLTMLAGMMPAFAIGADAATGNVIDAAIFCSDVHGSSSAVSSAFSGIKNADSTFDPSTATFVGDTQMAASSVTSAAQSVYSDVACYYAYGNHDSEGDYGIADVTGLLYTGNYYIYAISQTSMASSNPDTSDFTSTVAGLDKTKPLFIASHLPLHDRRGDSNGAAAWYEAISAAAESMDIVFFWAHNHTGENDVDRAAFYVEKNGTETITLENTSTVVAPNFTYMNAGFVGKDSSRGGVVSTVKIYSDALVFQDYTSSGAFTGEYSHNVEVTREFAATTDSGSGDGNTDTGDGDTTTETKEVYVLTDTLTNNGEYLIVNTNAVGSGYAMNHSSGTEGAVAVDIQESGDYIYIDLDDSTAVWTATTKESGFELMNGSYYLEAYGSTSAIEISTTQAYSARYWNYTDSALGYYGGNSTHYIYYDSGFVSAKNSGSEAVYIYEKQTITVSSDGTVSGGDSGSTGEGEDDTTGGSTDTTYGEGTYNTADDGSYRKVTFGSATTEKKTVYVLTSSISSGNSYLIVNGNSAGDYYALARNGSSVEATGVTVKTDSSIGTYIELTDATDELWTTSGSSSTTLKNGSYYLTYSGSKGNYSLNLSTSSTSWTYGSNRLSIVPNRTTYYLVYDSGWDMSSSGDNVYFYVPTEVEILVDTSVTYSVTASDIVHYFDADTTNVETETIAASVDSAIAGGTYTYTVESGEDIISVDENGTVTFTGVEGTAAVKVAYTFTQNGVEYTIWQVIDVTATQPTYAIDITTAVYDDEGNKSAGDSITDTVAIKGDAAIAAGYDLWAQVSYGDENVVVEQSKLTWTSSDSTVATVDADGNVTFTGKEGTVNITVVYEYTEGESVTDTVTFSVSKTNYIIPSDGTDDFPEYPKEGAIRYDKNAVAVGNFSQTGIAQLELSMTGVPYSTGSEIDVVLMLDMTGSMTDDSMAAAEAAAQAFADQIIKNEDGTYNSNRISVQVFNKNGVTELWAMSAVTADTYDSLVTAIESASTKQASGGTPYSTALSGCKDILDAARNDDIGKDRQQFCVFVSDGTPTSYTDVDGGSDTTKKEYYSSQMQADGVTVYGVYTSAAAGSSGSNGSGGSVNDTEEGTAIMQNVASSDDKVYTVDDYTDTSALTGVFTNIAKDIKQAAIDVVVHDQITPQYTMIFDVPTGSVDIDEAVPAGQEFYIEVIDYTLTPVYGDANDSTLVTDYVRSTGTSKIKLYLGVTGSTCYAATAANSTNGANAFATPTFDTTKVGNMLYWTTDSAKGDQGVSVAGADGTTYYFVSTGDGTHNMTAGAYAGGTIGDSNTSTDLIIATPYFVYNASTRMLVWTAEKLSNSELAITYFLYLDNSATEVGEADEVAPATYPTNVEATITYTNFQDNRCQQEFPIPQMTWKGAQVSYVFYLVNDAGQPVNRAGRVIPFSEAVYVTDVYTYSVVWNDEKETEQLSAAQLASGLVPNVYSLYDTAAYYEINVYESNDTYQDYFIIEGNDSLTNKETTKVFNTKSDVDHRYSTYGAYSSVSGNYTSNHPDGKQTYTATVTTGFDYSNTTVAFAVVWSPELVPDAVVIDYGLDVVIDVTANDALASGLVGVMNTPADATVNEGAYDTAVGSASTDVYVNGLKVATASKENQSVRFSLDKDNGMKLTDPAVFYYESAVNYYKESKLITTHMYSTVTVIPATTIYYEDEYVDLSSFTWDYSANAWSEVTADSDAWTWSQVGTAVNATQDVDRPGASSLVMPDEYDADNIYGYDSAYTDCSAYSMGSALMAHVDFDNYATASFSFYGTGFDVVALTSDQTGTVYAKVYAVNADGSVASTAVKNTTVDTYYGYDYVDTDGNGTADSWQVITDANGTNALYQVPVIKIDGLTYGQYKVVIGVQYADTFDHGQYPDTDGDGYSSYDFYLDAIRIYDPAGTQYGSDDAADSVTGNLIDSTIQDAYTADKEGWPLYEELRNNVITAAEATGEINGVVFIDGIPSTAAVSDYTSYGPNNELYLAAGQAIIFTVDLSGYVNSAGQSIVDTLQLGMKSADGKDVSCYIFDAAAVSDQGDLAGMQASAVATASDMYYDITALKDKTIVIFNDSDSVLSLTNLKVTFSEDPGNTEALVGTVSADELNTFVEALNTPAADEDTPEETEPSTEGTEDSGTDSTISKIISLLKKLFGWG